MNRDTFANPHCLTGTWTWFLFDTIADWVEDWLPGWLHAGLSIPILLCLLALASLEYALRFLLTPAKYWRRN